MPRERLRNRRRCIHDCIFWPLEGGRKIHVTAGMDDSGAIKELFLCGGGQIGSERAWLGGDGAVLVSIALQHGATLAELAHSLARDDLTGAPSSMLGAAIDCLAKIEADEAPGT